MSRELDKIAHSLVQVSRHVAYQQKELDKATQSAAELKSRVRESNGWLLLPILCLDIDNRIMRLLTGKYNFVYEVIDVLRYSLTKQDGIGKVTRDKIDKAIDKLRKEQQTKSEGK